ncbi:growth-regulating factor 3-like [Diospyros lotus]|uniref:growth-regulating factor 3-like n=1 Tax=Diospyros lotus TaxID=55363 RepID=UPI0022552FCD|nr:growth-regulating factor 3-like [Diospyros lotus]
MSGASSSLGAAGEGFRPPFTAAQWRELEHQALVYKYLVEGVPVPAELLVPIRQSFESMSARFFPHSSLGYFSYYGKKMDPEPGRCRRTDGKKWRCSKDAYPGSKYCERHMHRGRNRSRKPVESQSTSQSLLTVISQSGTGSSSGSSSFKNLPLQSMVNQDSLLGNNASKLQTEPVSNAMDNKEYRYLHGLKPEADEHGFHPEGPGSFQVLGMDQNVDNNTWHLMPSSGQVNRFPNPSYGAYLKSGFCQPIIGKDFESMSTPATSKQRQPHYFFGREVGSSGPVKQESHAARPFLDDWPRARDSWPELDDQGYDKKSSSTQLSISVPTPLSEISTSSACSPNGLGAED